MRKSTKNQDLIEARKKWENKYQTKSRFGENKNGDLDKTSIRGKFKDPEIDDQKVDLGINEPMRRLKIDLKSSIFALILSGTFS